MGVSEIRHISVLVLHSGCTSGTGTTLACFQSCGNTPFLTVTDVLQMQRAGSASHTEKSLRNMLGMSSGPGDLEMLMLTTFVQRQKAA